MDARSLKMKNQNDIEMSDDGTNNDYSTDEFLDSDDNTIIDEAQQVHNVIGTRSKRFRTTSYRDVVNGFRKHSSSLSSGDGKSGCNQKSIERMPTRRPNPKICNRNAVMARENRRKKKEYLETLQKDVDQFQTENKKLRKLLTARNSMISKLTHESMYLKSILANKTEIMALLKTIQGSRVPITSSALSFVTDPRPYNAAAGEIKREQIPSYQGSNSSSGCSPASASSISSPSPYTEDEKENGTNWLDTIISNHDVDPFLSTALIEPNSLFTDFDFPAQTFDNDLQWESLLNHSSGLKSNGDQSSFMIPELLNIDDCDILSTNGSHNVNHEHNYFNNPVKSTKVNDDQTMPATTATGVCLHVSGGKVSLEFCSQCHTNSQNAWIEEM